MAARSDEPAGWKATRKLTEGTLGVIVVVAAVCALIALAVLISNGLQHP